MCGLVGLVTSRAHRLPIEAATLDAMRDRLAHRGPDDAASWIGPHAALGHRRLAILDVTPAGRQPFCARSDGPMLVYNGELYNDHDLRGVLSKRGVVFQTECDTETLWHTLDRFGSDGIQSLRGMYAFAWYSQQRLVLARDPLGIKPLYIWEGSIQGVPVVAFASEIQALFAHPAIQPRPDMAGISAYLTNIRTVTGSRTMFAGVRALQPGDVIEYDLMGQSPRIVCSQRIVPRSDAHDADFADVFEQSVHLHLRSDVPLCAMLSGGLDSSAICAVARPLLDELHTYCAGSPDAPPIDGVPQSDDFPASLLVSEHLGTAHTQVSLDQDAFTAGWRTMVHRTGVPLSTPNEVAIHRVCQIMRGRGRVVALSGEGADELLGGYEAPMSAAMAHISAGNNEPGFFQLSSNAWCPPDLKSSVLTENAWRLTERDDWLRTWYTTSYEQCSQHTEDPLAAHLRFHREVNLTGLLGRLDSASMLASVEGRTPFADSIVAACAEALPMSLRYDPATPERTKIALRRAFQERLPESVVRRPKASFPVPFQNWMGGMVDLLNTSEWIREIIGTEAIVLVQSNPASHWRLAWPILNLALWGDRWWGGR